MTFSNRLIRWFSSNKRDLPWRNTSNSYFIWLSEVMLQQTQVKTVIPYYLKFIEKFPSIEMMAQTPIEMILKEWEGLGYYSRIRNFHKACQLLKEHNYQLKPDPEILEKLPGIGKYTLGAILSFAFKKRALAIDGNVIRFISRHFGILLDFSKPKSILQIEKVVEDTTPENEPHSFTEALIEFGALVCTPKPSCSVCPFKNSCYASQNDLTYKIPYKSKKIKIEKIYRIVFLVEYNSKYIVEIGAKNQVMQDLYSFPYIQVSSFEKIDLSSLISKIESKLNVKLKLNKELPFSTHNFTKFLCTLKPYQLTCKEIPKNKILKSKNEMENLPFNSGHKKILKKLLKS